MVNAQWIVHELFGGEQTFVHRVYHLIIVSPHAYIHYT